jgi:hypothetical protein
MPSDRESERKILARALAPGKECPPIERFEVCIEGDTIPPDLARHLESCAYCRAEVDLLRSFFSPPRDEAEAEAVRLISERLYSPRVLVPERSGPWWKRVFQARWLSPAVVTAAGLLIAVAVGVQWRQSAGPHLYAPNRPEQDVLRSGNIKVISPFGDIRTMPDQIQWEQVPGAAQYRVSILEVDHTELWTAATPQNRLEVPAPVKTKIVPAKTILVQIVAFDESNRKLAESDFVRFRLLQNVHNR